MATYASVEVRVEAKDAKATLRGLDDQAKKLNKTFQDSRGRLRNSSGQFVKMSKTAGTARQSFKLLGSTFTTYLPKLVAFGAAVKAVTSSMAIFSQREKDTAALANGIKGMTTDGTAALAALKKSADELGKATLFDEEDFTKGFKLLTSFKTIGVSSYAGVAKTAANMAQVLDQDVNSVMLQVAKALEAPEVGLTALQRSGTRFTDAQKQQVKAMVAANKTTEAQAFILKELERQYGGAAEAAAKGFAGAMDTLGELTRDAGEELGKFIAPAIIAGVKFLNKGIEQLGKFFNFLGKTVMPAAVKAAKPLIETFKSIFQKIDFNKVGNIIANVIVGSLYSMFEIASKITPVIAGILKAMHNLMENSPFGIMAKSIIRVAEALGLTKPFMEDFSKQADKTKTSFSDIPPEVDKAAQAQKRMVESLKQGVTQLEEQKRVIGQQEAAFNNAVNVTSARLNAEREINSLHSAQLEVAYKSAGTAKQRLNIAKAIFQNSVEAARIAHQQAMNEIEAARQSLEFKKQGAIIDGQILKARGEMAIVEAKNLDQKKAAQTQAQKALDSQMQAIRLIDNQIQAQSQVAEYQKQAAEAQFKAKVLAAEQSLKQKLVSDEIGLSQAQANNLAVQLSNGAIESTNLNTGMSQVKTSTEQTSFMMIRVATNAERAATAINNAAAAQRNLNAARAQGGGGSAQGAAQGAYWPGGFQAFAKGGMVTGPTLGLIGEGGEPEYIIPQSKAAGFAANYLSGQRGAGAIPAFADGGFVAPSSANVNIQTGPVTQMDGTNYVTTKDLGRAVQAGVNQTLDLIRRDGNTRAALGLS